MYKIIFAIAFLGLTLNVCAQGKIYKYTDEQGNIHYTDKKPSDDAEEAKLKSLTIVESQDVGSKTSWKRARHKEKFKAYNFDNFVITTPEDQASIWGAGGNLSVSVNINGKLPPNYRIKFFLDGIAHGKVRSNTQLIADVIRGEHTLYAQVIDTVSRQVIKTSPTITFYMKQQVVKRGPGRR